MRPQVLKDIDTLMNEQESLRAEDLILSASLASLQETVSNLYTDLGGAVTQVTADSLAIGDEIFLSENGVMTPFLVVHKNYQSAETVLCLRKYPLQTMAYIGGHITTGYVSSYIDWVLSNSYRQGLLVGASLVSATVLFISSSGASSLNREVFLPSTTEITGDVASGREGVQFDYFAQGGSLIATVNGAPVDWQTRTRPSNIGAHHITAAGVINTHNVEVQKYVRPCVNISNTNLVHKRVLPTTANVLATAEII